MPLTSGAKLGPYEVLSPLGAGGMGEVYRARDTRLGRDVALKILPESFARDADRLHRFELEARAVAALNHPNILAIYDVGELNGVPYLVSELLEGDSLRAMLDRGPLPQRKVIEYGVQIAQGLAAAHEKGIVHRDLKPENLFITRDGRAKVLDFGLAKLAQPAVEPDGHTLTGNPTAAGVVMGTASYMAPEQVRGEAVDARTDIFALGVVLFEMLSGQRAFHRSTGAETMTAVLRDDLPNFTDSQTPIAPALDRIIRRCLEKSPEQRFQSAKDLSFALGVLSGSEISSAARASQAAGKSSRYLLWACLALVLLALVTGLWFFSHAAPPPSRMEFAIRVPGEVSQPALSADGRMLAFISPDDKTGSPMLFIQRVGTASASEMPATDDASYPFWSPNGEFVAFFARGKLQKLSVKGGAPQVLAPVTYPRGGTWGTKNVIIYAPAAGGPLWRVNADGTHAAPLTANFHVSEVTSHRWPCFLPDGEHYLFLLAEFGTGGKNRSIVYLGSLAGGEMKPVIETLSNPSYASGHLFFLDDKNALRAAPFDIKHGITGDSRVIVDTVGYQPSVYWGAYAVAEDGTIIYNDSAASVHSVLTWFDRSGKELRRVGDLGVQANPVLSPDGNRVALDITSLKENNLDIWVEDIGKGTSTRFTFAPDEETDAIWSRDGSMIAFRDNIEGTSVKIQKANGLEPPKSVAAVGGGTQYPLFKDAYDLIPNSWAPDGTQILCSLQSNGQGSQLILLPVSGGEPKAFITSRASQTNGQISPDGKWVAYASNESGDWEIYVTTFPGAAGKWQISRGGGSEPRWRGDGKEIFFLGPAGTLMAASVDASQGFSSGTPNLLFQIRGRAPISSTDLFTYDVAKDGQRILVNQYVKPEHVASWTIVQHALAEAPK